MFFYDRFIEEQGQILRLHGACIRELQPDHEGRLLWRFRLPADKSTPLTSPDFVIRRCGSKVRLILDLVSSLVNNGAPTLSLAIDGKLTAGYQPLEGICRLKIFTRSRVADDYANQFSFVLDSRERDDTVGRQGLFGFMPTEQLYTGPYANCGNVVVFVAIDAKSD